MRVAVSAEEFMMYLLDVLTSDIAVFGGDTGDDENDEDDYVWVDEDGNIVPEYADGYVEVDEF